MSLNGGRTVDAGDAGEHGAQELQGDARFLQIIRIDAGQNGDEQGQDIRLTLRERGRRRNNFRGDAGQTRQNGCETMRFGQIIDGGQQSTNEQGHSMHRNNRQNKLFDHRRHKQFRAQHSQSSKCFPGVFQGSFAEHSHE